MNYATSQAELPEYARTLVAEVEQGTGQPLRISEQDGLGYDSCLAMATPTRPWHELAYTPQYAAHRVHFVVNAAVKIRRSTVYLRNTRTALVIVRGPPRRAPRSAP